MNDADKKELLMVADTIETNGGWRIAAVKIRGFVEDYDTLAAELAAAEKQWNVDVAARGKLLNRVAELEAALRNIQAINMLGNESRRIAVEALAQGKVCDRGRNSCNHKDAAQCCGGGCDGDCTCKICHLTPAETKAEPCEQHDWSPVGIPEGVFQCNKCGEIG